MKTLGLHLAGTGVYVPRRKVTAEELDAQCGCAPGTVLGRNRVETRYFASDDETASRMGAAAITAALAVAGRGVQDLDAILFTGVMSEQPMPCTAVLIHRVLQGRTSGVTCFDINASCAGFLKATETAAAGIAARLWRTVAVVSVEIASKGLRWDDVDTFSLFGDGAAAAIYTGAETEAGGAILAARSATYSDGAEFCEMRAGGSRFNVRTPPPEFADYLFAMRSRPLLRLVNQHFPAFLDGMFEESQRLGAPLGLVVPHQASAVGLAFLRKQLDGRDVTVVDILGEYGNQVSASIPFALHHAIERRQLERGATALLIGTAAGVAFSALLLRY